MPERTGERRQWKGMFLHEILDRDEDEVVESPEDKIPAAAVPEAGQGPDGKQIQEEASGRYTISAERDVYIIPEETAQRNVPATPEVTHRNRDIWIVEVFRIVEADHPTEAERHVGVGGEIEIELQHVAERTEVGTADGERGVTGERQEGLRECAEMIREYGLLREAHREAPEALCQILGIRAPMVHLLGHLRVACDRTLRHLVEGHGIQQHMEEIARRGLFRIDVGDVADQLKYIEGNAEWEANVSDIRENGRSRTRRGTTTCVEVACIGQKQTPADRTGKLIKEKHRDQQHEREDQPRTGTPLPLDTDPLRVRTLEIIIALLVVRIFRSRKLERPSDALPAEPGEHRHHQEQRELREPREGIKNQGKEEEHEVLPLISTRKHRSDHEDRQKQRYENQTRKAHKNLTSV